MSYPTHKRQSNLSNFELQNLPYENGRGIEMYGRGLGIDKPM